MKEFQHKRKIKRVLYSKAVIVLLGLVAILLLKPVWNVYQKKVESKNNNQTVEKELGALQDRQAVLASQVTTLTSQAGTEEEIRSKFNVAKEGEKMVIIVDRDLSEPPVVPSEDQGFFKKMWNSFVSLF